MEFLLVKIAAKITDHEMETRLLGRLLSIGYQKDPTKCNKISAVCPVGYDWERNKSPNLGVNETHGNYAINDEYFPTAIPKNYIFKCPEASLQIVGELPRTGIIALYGRRIYTTGMTYIHVNA